MKKLHSNSGRPLDPPIRWSLHKAETEFGHGAGTLKRGLKAAGISPGADGKYSTREIAQALFGFGTLERQAKEAKLQKAIDEGAIVRNERAQQEGKLVSLTGVKSIWADCIVKMVQFIRHCSMTEPEKNHLIGEIREWNEMTYGPDAEAKKRI
jgi:hypothetical protein